MSDIANWPAATISNATVGTGLTLSVGTLSFGDTNLVWASRQLKITGNNSTSTIDTSSPTLLLDNSGTNTILALATGGVISGAVRGDNAGNLSWHATGSQCHQFYSGTGTGTRAVGIGPLGIQIGNSAGGVPSGQGAEFLDSNNMIFGTSTGTKIGTATTQKLAFYNSTPIVQPNTTGIATGFTAGAGTAVNDQSTFTGGTGSTAYRISDVVRNLKNLGLLAA